MSVAGGGMSRRHRSVERCRVMWASKLRPCPESPWPNPLDAADMVAHRIEQDEAFGAAYEAQMSYLTKRMNLARQHMFDVFDAARRGQDCGDVNIAITTARRKLAEQLAAPAAAGVFAGQLWMTETVEDVKRQW